jgi:hypothetical protein
MGHQPSLQRQYIKQTLKANYEGGNMANENENENENRAIISDARKIIEDHPELSLDALAEAVAEKHICNNEGWFKERINSWSSCRERFVIERSLSVRNTLQKYIDKEDGLTCRDGKIYKK